ncbi:MAG: calcium/sodium antiporter [Clostridiales bacterium]|jgi:cation:H+ antiporter|nr:calcium/sodium antiporter [Clostridiales bacterium]
MDLLPSLGLLCMGLILLVKGADAFIDGALWFARRFRIPEYVIGATIVSIGTTLPETIVSATAAAHSANGIAYGNAIGSIICNTGLIVGLVLLFTPPPVEKRPFTRGALLFFIAAGIYIVSAAVFWGIPRFVGVVLLGLFVLYVVITLKCGKQDSNRPQREAGKAAPRILSILVSAALLYYGSRLMVENAEKIAFALAVPEEVIALSVVALGTSLPELVTAILAIRRGHGALSVGNVLGANFFNLVWVSGIATLIDPLVVDALAIRTDLIIMLLVTLVFTLPILARGKGSRVQGVALLAVYGGYVAALYH